MKNWSSPFAWRARTSAKTLRKRFSPSLKHVSRMERRGAFQFGEGIEESEHRVTGPRPPECIFHPAYNIKGITYRGSTASYVSSRGGGEGAVLSYLSRTVERGGIIAARMKGYPCSQPQIYSNEWRFYAHMFT